MKRESTIIELMGCLNGHLNCKEGSPSVRRLEILSGGIVGRGWMGMLDNYKKIF